MRYERGLRVFAKRVRPLYWPAFARVTVKPSGPFSALTARDTKRPPLLLAEAQLRDDGPITLHVCLVQVGELSSALADHHQETTSRVVVFAVYAQVLSEVVDPLGKQSDLNLGGACVRWVLLV